MKEKRCKIIAEAGVNHNGSIENAFRLIDVATECKADYIKFQLFNTKNLVTPTALKANYQVSNEDKNSSQYLC